MGEMKFYLFLGINKMKKPLLILFFLTMIFSCKENTEGISTNIQEKEDLDIPEYIVKITKLRLQGKEYST